MKKNKPEVRLAREMKLMDVTLIGVGAMIGAGIFVLTGIAAGVAGPALILVFILNGIVALLTAMSYAELGSCFHDAGGGYLWVKEGLPKWNGFISGWMSWFAHAVACSLYAIGFGAYFEYLFNELGLSMPHWGVLSPQKMMAAAVAITFGYINYRGASETGKVGNIATMAKIAILAVFIGFGLQFMLMKPDWHSAFTPFMPHGWSGVFKAMGLTFIAFEGYEIIAQCSEEVKNPKKNIPRAVFLSLIIVVPIYLLIAASALGSVTTSGMTPWDYLALHKELALVEVAKKFFSGGGVMILIGGLISTISALNATIYSSSRVAFAMGRDRNFPAFFSKVHQKKFTPHWAILVSLVIIVLMAVSLPIEDVASATDIMFLLLFLQVNIAMIRLRKKRPDLKRGFTAPLFPWLSVAGILSLLFLAVYMYDYSPVAWLITGVWIVVGMVIYYVYASRREIQHARMVQAIGKIIKKEYHILACLSNPKSSSSLIQIALAIAKKHDATITFMHLVEVGEGKPLRAGITDLTEMQDLLDKAEEMAEEQGISSHSLIEITHRISLGILDAAEEEECNFIVLGHKKRPNFMDRVFSSLIDIIIQKAPSEVAILHGELSPGKIRKVLLPFSVNVHTNLAAEIAPALIEYFGCQLTILAVIDPDDPEWAREKKIKLMHKLIGDNKLSAEIKILEERDILRGIVRESRKSDLLVMGAQTGSLLELLLGNTLAHDITEQAGCPVLWLKEYEKRETFWDWIVHPVKKEAEKDEYAE
jgi:amino acid transporter/nucleotide-binding universal stress UspA family protein